MKIAKLLSGFDLSALGMRAQRKKMDAIADNIANSETAHTEKGGPYRRRTVMFKAGPQQTFAKVLSWSGIPLDTTHIRHFEVGGAGFSEQENMPGAVEAKEQEDPSDFRVVHDPSHPDADENGYVKMPNVNIVSEMVDMVAASRSFEANVTAISAAKGIAKDSLEI